MASSFLGLNGSRPIFHMHSKDGQSESKLKGLPYDGTIFHSDLPYLKGEMHYLKASSRKYFNYKGLVSDGNIKSISGRTKVKPIVTVDFDISPTLRQKMLDRLFIIQFKYLGTSEQPTSDIYNGWFTIGTTQKFLQSRSLYLPARSYINNYDLASDKNLGTRGFSDPINNAWYSFAYSPKPKVVNLNKDTRAIQHATDNTIYYAERKWDSQLNKWYNYAHYSVVESLGLTRNTSILVFTTTTLNTNVACRIITFNASTTSTGSKFLGSGKTNQEIIGNAKEFKVGNIDIAKIAWFKDNPNTLYPGHIALGEGAQITPGDGYASKWDMDFRKGRIAHYNYKVGKWVEDINQNQTLPLQFAGGKSVVIPSSPYTVLDAKYKFRQNTRQIATLDLSSQLNKLCIMTLTGGTSYDKESQKFLGKTSEIVRLTPNKEFIFQHSDFFMRVLKEIESGGDLDPIRNPGNRNPILDGGRLPPGLRRDFDGLPKDLEWKIESLQPSTSNNVLTTYGILDNKGILRIYQHWEASFWHDDDRNKYTFWTTKFGQLRLNFTYLK